MLELTQIGGATSLRKTRFADGRVLTAEDLLVEQEANLARYRWLGTAVGTGVIEGFEVSVAGDAPTLGATSLIVKAGRAINRIGNTISLAEDARLSLKPQADVTPVRGSGQFTPVRPPAERAGAPIRVYLLTAEPAVDREGAHGGAAPMGRVSGGLHRYWVETVRFRLVELRLGDEVNDPDTLRNRLAYRCFGLAAAAALLDPSLGSPGGLADLVDEGAVTDAMLPLALVGWGGDGLLFTDQWAVRRRLHPRPALPWPLSGMAGTEAIAEAMILQFLAQVDEMRRDRDCADVVAAQHFRYLPPVGWLPLDSFQWERFLAGFEVERLEGDPILLPLWLREAQYAAPIDLAQPVPLCVYAPEGSAFAIVVRADHSPLRRQGPYEQPPSVVVELDLPRGAHLVPERFQVYASDPWGRAYPGELRGNRWAVAGLAAGEYTLWVREEGCQPTFRWLEYAAGRTEVVRMAPGLPVEPALHVPPERYSETVEWTLLGFAGEVEVRPDQAQWGELPAVVREWVPLDLAVAGLQEWFIRWGAWLRASEPTLPVDPESIYMLLSPQVAGEAPEADGLVVFGYGGVHMPLRLLRAVLPEPEVVEEPFVDPERAELVRALLPARSEIRQKKRKAWVEEVMRWFGL